MTETADVQDVHRNQSTIDADPHEQDIQLPVKGLSKILQESTRDIKKQLAAKGIKLLNIGITTWDYVNQELAEKLGEGAVIQSQIRSKIMAARQAAKVKTIEAKAEADSQIMIAAGQAESIGKVGNAFVDLAETMKENLLACQLYQMQKQVDMVSYSDHPQLFFNMGLGANAERPVMTLPLNHSSTSSTVVKV